MVASLKWVKPRTKDITKAYIKSYNPMQRYVIISTPAEMNLPADTVPMVVRPLYGIPKSGVYWYLKYTSHHAHLVGMFGVTVDPCVSVERNGNNLRCLVFLQVDDIMAVCI